MDGIDLWQGCCECYESANRLEIGTVSHRGVHLPEAIDAMALDLRVIIFNQDSINGFGIKIKNRDIALFGFLGARLLGFVEIKISEQSRSEGQ